MQKIFTFSRKARAMLGERALVDVPVEEGGLDLGPVRRVRDAVDERREEDERRDEREGDGATAPPPPPRIFELRPSYFRTGAPVTLASQICWIRFSTPVRFICASALLTQPISGLPFRNTIPKRSCVPFAWNWPMIFPFGTCTAVT